MNEREHKAIAKIIKKNTGTLFWGGEEVIKLQLRKDLADYFEKEAYKISGHPNVFFKRKQFLKDCGVEK